MASAPAAVGNRLEYIIPIALGLFAFVLVTGGAILLPDNIAWLALGDPRQHYLGWAFFRQDGWHWPLGLNPDFGLELGSAIAFSDSLPLFALPFKALAPWLPPVFQYFGLWVLLCFVLQAIMAWKICGLITRDVVARTAMTGFFVFAPPMLWRLHGHMSLVGHFLLLAAIYLSLVSRERRRAAAFVILVALSAAVHAYLLAMVAAIWLASLADSAWRRSITWRVGLLELGAGVTLVTLVCWQVGFFSVGKGVASGGYGLYRMNLLSLFNPDGWSRFLPGIRGGEGDYEGFNYLGIGLILLALVGIPLAWGKLPRIKAVFAAAPFSCLLVIGITLFALSNVVGLGGWSISYPLPRSFEKITNVFRSSGRMFWPVYYLLVLIILLAAMRGLGLARARWFLAGALVLQVADTSAGWSFRHIQLTQPRSDHWATPMQDPFWDEAGKRYTKVRWILPENQSPEWSHISGFAVRHGMATDATFLARIGTEALETARENAALKLRDSTYDADSLYLVDKQHALGMNSQISPDDMLAVIDGFFVLAPGWRACGDCPQDYSFSVHSLFGPLVTGQDIALFAPEHEPYRAGGWSGAEPWGVWSSADKATLGFASPLPRRFRLTMDAQAFGPNAGKDFMFSAGAAPVPVRISRDMGKISLELEAAPQAHMIEIGVPQATSPQELGMNDDTRQLGIGVSHFRIDPLN